MNEERRVYVENEENWGRGGQSARIWPGNGPNRTGKRDRTTVCRVPQQGLYILLHIILTTLRNQFLPLPIFFGKRTEFSESLPGLSNVIQL